MAGGARVAASTPAYSEALLEIICYTHPAVDPETGHLVCHHHSVGAAVLEAPGGGLVPALLVGGCAYLVEGTGHARALLEGARRVALESLGPEEARGGGGRGDAYWVAQAVRAAVELRLAPEAFEVEVEGEQWLAIALTSQGGVEAVVLVPPKCGEDRFQKKSQTFYQ